MRTELFTILIFAAALSGCMGAGDGLVPSDEATNKDIEAGCAMDDASGLLTSQDSLTVQAEAEGSGASAQFRLDHVGVGAVELALHYDNNEVERWESDGQGGYGNNAHNLAAGNYTLTASVQDGIRQVDGLSLEISWGGAECP